MAHIEPLIDAQPAAQILGLLPVTRGASVPNGSMESHADRTLGDQFPMQPVTLKPFTAQFAAEWQKGCGNGELLLCQSEVRPL